MASWMTCGCCSGTERSSAASISTARSAMYFPKSKEGLELVAEAAVWGRTDTSAVQRGAWVGGAAGVGRWPGDTVQALGSV